MLLDICMIINSLDLYTELYMYLPLNLFCSIYIYTTTHKFSILRIITFFGFYIIISFVHSIYMC